VEVLVDAVVYLHKVILEAFGVTGTCCGIYLCNTGPNSWVVNAFFDFHVSLFLRIFCSFLVKFCNIYIGYTKCICIPSR